MELSPDGIAVHSEGRLVFVNAAGARMLGASDAAELVGRPIATLIHPESRELIAERIDRMHAARQAAPLVEEKFVGLDGESIDVEVAAAPLVYGGKPAVLVICRDIAERKRSQQLRDQYLSAVSHDLRTPLTSIVARAQRLERRLAGGDVDDLASARAIIACAHRMAHMLDDLREAARLEGGRETPDVQPIALGAFLGELLARNAGGIDVARVRLEVDPATPVVRADPERLERVVLNLISNGLKYSPAGRPVLVGAEPRGDEVVVSVTDQGCGIAPEVAPHVFDRFFRAPGARQEGLGLGLHIARGLVEAQGGRIWVESEPRMGATFNFTLPHA